MITVQKDSNDLLCRELESLTDKDKDYWSFKGNSRREYGHGMFQYPAMMVPQVVEAILDKACLVHSEIERVGDPFVGSGTIITESMMRGLAFSGTDINPLAILICRVKRGPFFIAALKDKAKELLARIGEDGRCAIEADFPNRDKWFGREVQLGLSKIRRAIRGENAPWARRFFWVALAETVRTTSNSRTSTFKLHIRTQENIDSRSCNPVGTFQQVLERNIQHYKKQSTKLFESGQLVRGHYQREVAVSLADIRKKKSKTDLDIVITSPPYGDNETTVPYGQYSYLPLQWVDLHDIGKGLNNDCLASTHEIDARSLGGSKKVKKEDADCLKDRSSAFASYIKSLDGQPRDRALRVTAFFRDLDACLAPILESLRPGGLMIWTLGNRKVGGKRVPLDSILADMLRVHHATLLCQLTRRIPSKRMALKNNIADTMSSETILVMRKAV